MGELLQYFGTVGHLQLIGVLGFLIYVFSFGGVQFGWLDGNGWPYSFYNVLAASLVAISLVVEFNLSSALIQGSWIGIGLVGLSKRLFGKELPQVQSLTGREMPQCLTSPASLR
ncbi:MAG: hypothetical protein V3V25_13315 [Paracoccaceae bacterium]